MLVGGVWHQCDDGIIRPVIQAEILAHDHSWWKAPFLLDTGADRTVLSADVLTALRLSPIETDNRIGGVGGIASAVSIETQIRLSHDKNGKVLLRGRYAGVTSQDVLDISVLGRDITNLFAVLVDWPQKTVCLLSQRHRYTIIRQ
jgi:predicted aspartyl protease